MAITGIKELSEQQQELMKQVNQKHTKSVGNDYKNKMQIQKVWLDENDCICVLLENGEWYHYTKEKEWY